MSKCNSYSLRNAYRKSESSGMCFIGSPNDNYHLIVRCPIHIFCAIKKAFNLLESPPMLSFYSCSLDITHLALPQFCGTFLYRQDDGKQKKFQAAFVYPLDLNDIKDGDFLSMHMLLQVFKYKNWNFYDRKDKSIETLFHENYSGSDILLASGLEDFIGSLLGVSSDSSK